MKSGERDGPPTTDVPDSVLLITGGKNFGKVG
jgi:hypothetical protein